jgi:replicative DNA helicase
MSKEQLELRLLSSESRVPHEHLRTGYVKNDEWKPLTEAMARIAVMGLGIEDSSDLSVLEMRAILRRVQRERRIDLVAVDYIQLVRPVVPNKFSREQEVASISRDLKGLGKDFNVPVVALAQLNRQIEMTPNRRPRRSDLRESGQIEQDADVIAFLWANPNDNPDSVRLLLVEKQRNGKCGDIKLTWQGDIVRFDSWTPESDEHAA